MRTPVVCAAHQPNFFPRLSTLDKIFAADIWIVLDNVQLSIRDYQHRTRLLTPDATQQQWLSLPIHRPSGRATRINKAQLVDPTASARRVNRLVRHYYAHSRRWPCLEPLLAEVTEKLQTSDSLAEVTELSTRLLLTHMGWTGTVVRASAFSVDSERSTRLAELAAAVGATEYLCGTGGARYLDTAPFTARNITVRYRHALHAGALRDHKHVSSLWWLAAVSWGELYRLFWQQPA